MTELGTKIKQRKRYFNDIQRQSREGHVAGKNDIILCDYVPGGSTITINLKNSDIV